LQTIILMNKLFYQTVATSNEYEIPKIKWSRFIGNIFHITNKEEADRYIHDIQQKYPDASHHCFAYRYDVQIQNDIFWNIIYTDKYHKLSDAGEPTNTAGKPIMSMIEKHELHNVLVVVTRYFGGTLLGVGWLIQAYGEAAKKVIEKSKFQEAEITKLLEFSYPFDLLQAVRNILNKYNAKIIEEKYDKDIEMKIAINHGYYSDFSKDIFENSKWKVKI